MEVLRRAVLAIVMVAAAGTATCKAADRTRLAEEILRSSGIKGGLCVHVGVTDGRLAAELSDEGRFLVQGLAAEAAAVEKAREHIRRRGIYGRVSVDQGSLTKLPYDDDLVNLLVIDDLPDLLGRELSLREVLRVLVPGGVAYLGAEDARRLSLPLLKTRLAAAGIKEYEIIERSGRWVRFVKPRPTELDEWTHWRHAPDGNMVSTDTVVGIPSRLKWIDEPTWARSHALVGCSRAMVSANGRVFYAYDEAPRGLAGPMRMTLTGRDAFNGLLLWKHPIESTTPLGISGEKKPYYWDGGYYWYLRRSLVAVGDRVYSVLKQGGPLLALDAATGEVVKTYDEAVAPREVVCHGDLLVLVLHKDKRSARFGYGTLCAIDADTGKLRWKKEEDRARYVVVADGRVFFDASTELVCLDVVDGREIWRAKKPDGATVLCFHRDGRLFLRGSAGNLFAVSAEDGAHLWSFPYKALMGPWYSDTEVYALGGLVWVYARDERWCVVGLDPATGKEKRRIDFPEEYPGTRGHHRCHPNRATERYFLLDTHGIDFVDWRTEKICDVRSYRGNCYVGFLPANGLLYLPPNACQCGEYFRGLMALAPIRQGAPAEAKVEADGRFVRGEAFGAALKEAHATAQEDWPCHRHDPQRTGGTAARVPGDLKLLWERKIGGKVTSPTIAEGMVFLARPGLHEVCAFDAKTGEPRWSYTAGAAVDSSPTIHAGLALFGCRDGWAYCLRAADGKLVWRFRAAPRDRRIAAFGQLESAWPVHGSVLVQDGAAFFAAGRSSELDGGICIYAVEPKTGKILWQKQTTSCLGDILAGKVWDTGYIPLTLNDILIGGHDFVSIRYTGFDAKTGEIKPRTYPWWARTGMLDGGAWVGRARWRGPKTRAELLVFDRETTYGVLTPAGSERLIEPGQSEYRLFAVGARAWSHQVPLRINAMVLAADTLFVAGTPDVIDETDYWAALDGRKGAELWALSADDGTKRHTLKLETPPVFDGMAAARGRLYLATTDGRLLCFGKK